MTLEDYTAWSIGADRAELADRPDDRSLCDAGLAMVGDAGEVVECLRRLIREGDRERERLAGELGDVWRYWSRLGAASGVAPGELLARSRVKIEGRLATAGQMKSASGESRAAP